MSISSPSHSSDPAEKSTNIINNGGHKFLHFLKEHYKKLIVVLGLIGGVTEVYQYTNSLEKAASSPNLENKGEMTSDEIHNRILHLQSLNGQKLTLEISMLLNQQHFYNTGGSDEKIAQLRSILSIFQTSDFPTRDRLLSVIKELEKLLKMHGASEHEISSLYQIALATAEESFNRDVREGGFNEEQVTSFERVYDWEVMRGNNTITLVSDNEEELDKLLERGSKFEVLRKLYERIQHYKVKLGDEDGNDALGRIKNTPGWRRADWLPNSPEEYLELFRKSKNRLIELKTGE